MTRKKGVKKSWTGKVKLTDAEQHKRFVETSREVGADEHLDSFDKAFKRVVEGASKR